MTCANYIIQARVIWLGESIEDLTSKNELLAAQVASLTTESSSSKHRARNPRKEPPNCWKACLPIQDIAFTDPKHLYVVSWGAPNRVDILKMLKEMKPSSYEDITIHCWYQCLYHEISSWQDMCQF